MKKFDLGKATSNTGEFIANNKKPLLYIGGAIAIVVIGYAFVKKIKSKLEGSDVKGGKYNEQNVDVNKLSINNATAKNYAEQLFRAMNYTYGTDKAILDSIFSKINSEDFKMIYNEFGQRSYSSAFVIGGSPSAVERLLGSYEDIDLVEWLNNELGVGDSALREKIRKVIQPSGFVLEK
jgi:hypothetical protein